MAATCPHCNVPLTTREAQSAECPVCRSPLSAAEANPSGRLASLGRAAPGATAVAARPAAGPKAESWSNRIKDELVGISVASSSPQNGHCHVCCRTQPDVQPRYVRLYRMSLGVTGSVSTRWYTLTCSCCESCYRKRIRLQRQRIWGVLAMLVLPILSIAVFASLLAATEGLDSKPLSAVLIGGMIFFGMIVPFVGIPFLLHRSIRRNTEGIFGPEGEAKLKTLIGVRKWGLRGSPVFVKRIAPRDRPIPIEQVLAAP